MSQVNIVYTNGVESYKVYWVKQSGNNIYHGFYFRNKLDLHWSHHESGKVHAKADGSKLSFPDRIPIAEVKDIYNLQVLNAGDMEWARKYYKPYRNEKLRSILWVDTRLFPNDFQIQIELYLLRPEYISVLSNDRFRKTNKGDYRLIQIIQDINPWLIIHIRNLKNLT